MTADQEKMFYKAIDNLKEATTEEEKDKALDSFLREYTGGDLKKPLTGEAEKNESEGTKEFIRYRVRTEDLLGDLYDDIDKANMVLGEFIEEYYFKDGLHGYHLDWDSEENRNLTKWVWEYKSIMLHLDIVQDYVLKVLLALRERLETRVG